MPGLTAVFPILRWGRGYDRQTFSNDIVAALIATSMLVPQSLAYAMLAGLPPSLGLYASILPLIAYALFGASRAVAVGPVAIVSLMSANAVGHYAAQGSEAYIALALVLAALSGLILILMGVFRLGFLTNLLPHPVISGFMTASGVLIAFGQFRHILGIGGTGDTLFEMSTSLLAHFGELNPVTLAIGSACLFFSFWGPSRVRWLLRHCGTSERVADLCARTSPVMAGLAATLVTMHFGLAERGVAIVGAIPRDLPSFHLPVFDAHLWAALLPAAFFISLIGFVQSIAVAQTFAAKNRESIDPNQELVGLGMANIAAAFSGGFVVTGGFARSAVNFLAGAQTPAAGAFTAIGTLLVMMVFAPGIAHMPVAALGATIIVAALSLVDFATPRKLWAYSKSDFAAMLGTILVTLSAGVEAGLAMGVVLSVALSLWRASRPHVANVGLVPGTQHFRNVLRHPVETANNLMTLRIDDSMTFVNARWLENKMLACIAERPQLEHMILMCSAVNEIDASALESLKSINRSLADAGIRLHLSEVKGPVMDRLQCSDLLGILTGQVFLSQYDAFTALAQGRESPSSVILDECIRPPLRR